MTEKTGHQIVEMIFQQEAYQTEEPKKENGGESEPDKVSPAWRSQAGNAAPGGQLCSGSGLMPERAPEAEGRCACWMERLRDWGGGCRRHISAEERGTLQIVKHSRHAACTAHGRHVWQSRCARNEA